jgi:hypothetical protein
MGVIFSSHLLHDADLLRIAFPGDVPTEALGIHPLTYL